MDVHLPFCMSFFHLVDFFVGLGDKLHRGAFPDIQVKFLTVTVHNSCGRREQHDLDTAVRFPERVHDFVGGSKADILQNRPVFADRCGQGETGDFSEGVAAGVLYQYRSFFHRFTFLPGVRSFSAIGSHRPHALHCGCW